MAGSLRKIDEEIVSSAVASVTLTGIDSTYDVYKVVINNLQSGSFESVKVNNKGVLNFGGFTSAPDVVEGGIYYDTTDNEFYLGV